MGPGSSAFRARLTASSKYGLTVGSFYAESVRLTSLGEKVTMPTSNVERSLAKRQAFLSVQLFKQILDHFANAKLPDEKFLPNSLMRPPFNVPRDWALDCATVFRHDAEYLGYLRDDYLVVERIPDRDDPGPPEELPARTDEEEHDESEPESDRSYQPTPSREERTVRFFIAHGKNHRPLAQLKALLDEWNVAYKVVQDEPHAGRPISKKVADTMKECTAGIFIFTTEDGNTDEAGKPLPQPNLNVVFELGAASLLYGRKIVIFKQSGVTFPSDFSDLGWISFDGDDLHSATGSLLKELIGLGAIRIVGGS